MADDCFKVYNSIFDLFGFGLRVRSRLLSRIYPFEAFLSADGKPLIEHEVREVRLKPGSYWDSQVNEPHYFYHAEAQSRREKDECGLNT